MISIKESQKLWKAYLKKKDIEEAMKPCCIMLEKLTQEQIKKHRVTTAKERTIKRKGSVKEEEFIDTTTYKKKYKKHWRRVQKECAKRWNKRRLNVLFKQLEEEEEEEQRHEDTAKRVEQTLKKNSKEKEKEEQATQIAKKKNREAVPKKDDIEEILKILGEGEESEEEEANIQKETIKMTTEQDVENTEEEMHTQQEDKREINTQTQEAKEIYKRMEDNRNKWTKWMEKSNKKGHKS